MAIILGIRFESMVFSFLFSIGGGSGTLYDYDFHPKDFHGSSLRSVVLLTVLAKALAPATAWYRSV